jgi:hypothetical protein
LLGSTLLGIGTLTRVAGHARLGVAFGLLSGAINELVGPAGD